MSVKCSNGYCLNALYHLDVIQIHNPYVHLRQNSQFHPQASLSKCGLVNLKKKELPRHRDTKNNLVKTTRQQEYGKDSRKFSCKRGLGVNFKQLTSSYIRSIYQV